MLRLVIPAFEVLWLKTRRWIVPAGIAAAVVCALSPTLRTQAQDAASLPAWAYTAPAPRAPDAPRPAPLDDTTPLHLAGSKAEYTAKFIANLATVTDWFPDTHPTMPEVVESGHKPGGAACAHCHLPNGLGGPENANLAGQSQAYMLQQMADFQSGARQSAVPTMGTFSNMARTAKALTPEETKASIAYFASLKAQPWVRVIESDTAPQTHVGNYILVPNTPVVLEPIGERIIEVPVDAVRTEMKDSTASYIAYVPKGSLARGEALVKTGGGGKTMPCATCHGADLHGAGTIPAIAGRTPSGMTRQLIDIQRGTRNGAGAAMMKPVVANLTTADMVAITAYLASLKP
jgi:cytochrome c553